MGNHVLNKNGVAEAAIAAFRIVKFGAADGGYVQGAAATDSLVGVSEGIPADVGERLDVIKIGIAPVEFGGAVTRGGPVTSDADGKAVAAAPAAGANVRVIGYAEVSAVAGDIADILLSPGVMQG